MTSKELFLMIDKWKQSTYLNKYDLIYDEDVYSQALSNFLYDYIRWFPYKKMQDSKDISVDLIDSLKLELTPQLHGILMYRLSSLFYKKNNLYGGGGENNAQCDIIANIGRIHSLSEIYYSAIIDKGLKINHGVGLVVGARCKIGKNCILHQNVTLGDKGGGRPIIGDDCIIYAGSSVLGNVKIGNGCIVGANSLVISDFPDNSVIAGVPAKIIKNV